MNDWNINKPLGRCSGTDREIEYGQEYFAALVETEQGLQRQDFSTEYWQQHKPQVYCFWKTKLPYPDQKKNIFVDNDMLLAFFDRLAAETEQEKINFRFILTLVLMRKRRLKYELSKNENGREIWKLKVAGEKRTVEVTNPSLAPEEIERLSSQMGRILQVEL